MTLKLTSNVTISEIYEQSSVVFRAKNVTNEKPQ